MFSYRRWTPKTTALAMAAFVYSALLLFFIIASNGACASDTAAKPEAAVVAQRYCQATWPVDFEMQLDCRKRQMQAALEIGLLWHAMPLGSEERAIVERCFAHWTISPDGLVNYEMALDCGRREIAAHAALIQLDTSRKGNEQ